MKAKKYNNIIGLIVIFILTIVYNLAFSEMVHDEVWIYGFAKSISNGMLPYKDFNMIITPLYPATISLVMYIFGRNIISMHILNALICTSIFYYIKKITQKGYYIVYAIFLLYSAPGYNLTCLLFLYILMSLEKRNSNDYLVGIVLGITFLTKQSTGIYLCIPTLFTKDIKKIIRRIIGFLIPITIFIIYLLTNNIFLEFIDYCFLGIGAFANKNLIIDIPAILIVLISIVYLVYKYVKTKEINIIYIMSFFIMTYPIFDFNHIIFPFIATFSIFLNELKLNNKVISYTFIIFILSITILNVKDYLFGNYKYPNKTNEFKYCKINNDIVNNIIIISNYLKENKENTYIIDPYAYLIKLETDIPLNKYDLLNNGNMGKNGQYKIIDEFKNTCNINNCRFLLYKGGINNYRYSQYNQDIYNYVIENYHENGKISGLTIYTNYKKE